MIESLFPQEVVALEATEEMWSGPLLPDEEACLSPRAVLKRRREFTAGRVCARAALRRLGVVDFPLRAAPDRMPLWPPGIVGSLSHCGDCCGVAVAREGAVAGLGLDVERARPLEDRVVALVCSESERARIAGLPGLPAGLGAIIVFCAKESAYKCHYPLARTFLDFHDVEIDLEPGRGTFTATIRKARNQEGCAVPPRAPVLRGRFAWNDTHVCAGVTLTAPELQPGP
ncbi:MAG TPA: 4'-phosphopantetheinyl transferase superfamily protein [Candidatus Dormibacteraeota bacterium]|nr:4'-phosphopantetheinyl transferase superfamily protein [Candidatus Dormibacteraeota bacterium]